MVWPCLPACFLGQLFVSPLLPTCFLTRLLRWMLSRDALARSALCLPTCCLPACFLTRLLRWMLSRDVLARSALSPHLFPFVSSLGSSRACWAGCCHEMVWLGQPFVSLLVSICLFTWFLTRLLGWMLSVTRWSGSVSPLSPHLFPFVSSLGSSRACCAGCCHEMFWLGQPFVPTCFHLSLHLVPHALAGLDAVTRWSGSVSSLSPCLFPRALTGLDAVMRWSGSVSSLSPHLFPHALAGLDAVSGSVSSLSPYLFPHLLGGLARSALCLPACFLVRLLGWILSRDGLARSALCLPSCFLLSPHLFPGLDAVTRRSGSVSPLSPHLFAFVSPLVSTRTCWSRECLARSALCLPTCFLTRSLGACCHEMVWLGQPFVSLLVSARACWAGCCHKMVPACFHLAVGQYACFRKAPSSREKKFLSRIFRDSIATPFCLQPALWSHCGCCSCACKHSSRSSLALAGLQ